MSQETLKEIEESDAYREIEINQAKRYILLARICLVLLIICVLGFIYLFPKFTDQGISGVEPVQVTVSDVSKSTVITNTWRKPWTKRKTDFYDITVLYDGNEYKMHDWDTQFTKEGYTGTAYMYDGEIYAKENGPATETVLAKIYYVCLIGGFILLIVTVSIYPKAMRLKKGLKRI